VKRPTPIYGKKPKSEPKKVSPPHPSPPPPVAPSGPKEEYAGAKGGILFGGTVIVPIPGTKPEPTPEPEPEYPITVTPDTRGDWPKTPGIEPIPKKFLSPSELYAEEARIAHKAKAKEEK